MKFLTAFFSFFDIILTDQYFGLADLKATYTGHRNGTTFLMEDGVHLRVQHLETSRYLIKCVGGVGPCCCCCCGSFVERVIVFVCLVMVGLYFSCQILVPEVKSALIYLFI